MLENTFSQDPLKFAKKYSFFPGDAAEGYLPTGTTSLDGVFSGFRHTPVADTQRVARIELAKGASSRGEAVMVKPSLIKTTGLPTYFLPWDCRGAAVELTIPSRNPDIPEAVHPRFFFTAVLSGCTVLFSGDRQNPTIMHCGTGGETGGGASTQGNSNDYFIRMAKTLKYLGVGSGLKVKGVIRSNDYMVTKNLTVNPDLKDTTDEAMGVLKARYGGLHVVEECTPWGMVFGVRDGRNWTFYLQKNVTIVYKTMEDVMRTKQVKKKSWLGLRSKVVEQQFMTRSWGASCAVSRPIEIDQVFPGGGRAFVIDDSWRPLV